MASWEGSAVIFDLDGVLIHAEAIYERHWRHWAEQHGIDYETIAAVHHGRPSRQTIELAAPHLDAAEEAESYNAGLAADTDMTGVEAFSGAADLVASLPRNRWAIATSGPRLVAQARLDHLRLPTPGVFITIDDVSRGKPEPEPYLLAASQLGFEPDDCLVIEDAPAGIEAAKAAGCCVLALATTNAGEALKGAEAVVDHLTDIKVDVLSDGLRVTWPDS